MDFATTDPAIDAHGRAFLLTLARTTIQNRLDGEPLPSREPDLDVLLEHRGAFVTLKIDRRLRGCIGHVVGVAPLWLTVRDNAIAAAFEDPRFDPLEADEFSHTVIEISVLSPLRAVTAEEVIVGRHGILIERGMARGLLLPQVAVEHGWERVDFLDHTCRKAGLESGCWTRSDTVISVFSAEVFGEGELRRDHQE